MEVQLAGMKHTVLMREIMSDRESKDGEHTNYREAQIKQGKQRMKSHLQTVVSHVLGSEV